jgi:A/G-specific adenine glycosylase
LEELANLPGIGRSTAGAILSFAFNKDAAILDGNAKRVLSRLFAVLASSKKGKTENSLWQISESLIPKGFSNPFNQSLMDLGSMICTPKDPFCPECPLRDHCKGKRSGEPERFPLKIPKKKIPHVEAVCAVIWKKGEILLDQRPPSGLLGGLWEFPNWKSKSESKLRLRNDIQKEIGMDVEVKESIGTFRQTFSHFKLTLHVYHCQPMYGKGKGKWVPIGNLHLLPMSRIHRRIAESISN